MKHRYVPHALGHNVRPNLAAERTKLMAAENMQLILLIHGTRGTGGGKGPLIP